MKINFLKLSPILPKEPLQQSALSYSSVQQLPTVFWVATRLCHLWPLAQAPFPHRRLPQLHVPPRPPRGGSHGRRQAQATACPRSGTEDSSGPPGRRRQTPRFCHASGTGTATAAHKPFCGTAGLLYCGNPRPASLPDRLYYAKVQKSTSLHPYSTPG